MNSETLARVTFVLDRHTAQDLAYLSSRMGQSRSALVREVLAAPVSSMAEMLRQVPPNPTPADVRQLALNGLEMAEDLLAPQLEKLRELSHE